MKKQGTLSWYLWKHDKSLLQNSALKGVLTMITADYRGKGVSKMAKKVKT